MILRRIYINGFACCSLAWLMPTTWIRSGLCIRNKQPGVGNMILWKRWRIGLMPIWNRLRQMRQHLSSMRNGRLSCPVAGRWPRAFPAFLAWQFRQVGERHWRRWLGHSFMPFVTKKTDYHRYPLYEYYCTDGCRAPGYFRSGECGGAS